MKGATVEPTYDVAIVGYGPVGQLLATLLGRRGHQVVVIERYPAIYPRPRAVHFDHEIARILQSVGIRSDTDPIIEPYDNWYEWRNAERETLLKVDWRGVGPSWWHTSNFFAQPDLEQALAERAEQQPQVTLYRELTAVGYEQDANGVTLAVRPAGAVTDSPAEMIRARYLVGCDGANSIVRTAMDTSITDLGFFFDWLILDMIPNEPMTFDPPAWQLCDPKRPTTIVPGGPGRRRWEFMALPGEDISQLDKAETAWAFLEPWGITPDNAVLERHTVYRFQARWVDRWLDRRVLIAGDAAHLMPPFAGQGMCGGLRDVVNLEWKLDAVLRGIADDRLLETYGTERNPHVQYFINMSIDLGRVICVPDEAAAAERDARMKAALTDKSLAPPAPPPPRLGPGLLAAGDAHAGLLSIQSRVGYGDRTGLFDDLLGHGWFVLTTASELPPVSGAAFDAVERLGVRILRMGPLGSGAELIDIDGRYAEWLAELSADTVVVRPDFYIYAATVAARLPGVLSELGSGLGLLPGSGAATDASSTLGAPSASGR